MSEARRIILPRAIRVEACEARAEGAFSWRGSKAGEEYFLRPVKRLLKYGKHTETYSWNLLPVIVDGNQRLWPEGSLYLLDRIITDITPSMKTYHSIADDLAVYRRWLEDEDVDFLHFPSVKLDRPTYRFRGMLKFKVNAGEVAHGSARRMVSSVIGFYKWLRDDCGVVLANPPWTESDVYIPIADDKGLIRKKQVKTTDLRIHVPKQSDPYAETIDDGGKLRPLTIEEQTLMLETLSELGNTEMTLIHLVALFTGARIQTVLTIRVRHVRLDTSNFSLEVRLPVGHGTLIDTKHGKQGAIFVPGWLYEALRTYSYSERALKRRTKAGGGTEEDRYLFVSQRGTPFYRAKQDRDEYDDTMDTKYEKVGQAIRVFIRDRVLPAVEKKTGNSFHYRFHDLRATYGMNLTDSQLMLVEEGKKRLHEAHEFVRVRMMHESFATTERYLKYRRNLKHLRRAQAQYEAYLEKLIGLAKGMVA